MSIFKELSIGTKLNMNVSRNRSKEKKDYSISTQIIDIKDKYLYIATPIYRGITMPLYQDQKVEILYKNIRGIYIFTAQVVEKIETNITIYSLLPLGEPEKTQRRNYYRLPVVTDIVIRKFKNNEVVEFRCVTKDLSARGAKFISDSEFTEEEEIIADIYLSKNEKITVKGKVRRSIKDMGTNTYEVGIEFKDMDTEVEDRVIAYIFKRQRLLRKKGLI